MKRIELYPRGSDNRYIVVGEDDQFLKLECVWFCAKEDLGDGIYCFTEGEAIWMAKYHTNHYVREEVDIVE